jgi:hypothetical protein
MINCKFMQLMQVRAAQMGRGADLASNTALSSIHLAKSVSNAAG